MEQAIDAIKKFIFDYKTKFNVELCIYKTIEPCKNTIYFTKDVCFDILPKTDNREVFNYDDLKNAADRL